MPVSKVCDCPEVGHYVDCAYPYVFGTVVQHALLGDVKWLILCRVSGQPDNRWALMLNDSPSGVNKAGEVHPIGVAHAADGWAPWIILEQLEVPK